MTDICELHRDRIAAAFGRLVASGRLPAVPPSERIVVEPTRDPAHGDLATGVAMTLGKAFGMPPSAIAAALADELAADPGVVSAAVAGPGFVNVALAPEAFGDAVRSAVSSGAAYGRRPPDGTPPMVVEFVSANPTGPMHVGHGRGAVVGDALASLLAFAGRTVSREYYVNDAGAQVDVLARSVFVRYLEALGEKTDGVGEGLYPGEYLVPVGQALADGHGRAHAGRPEAEWLPPFRDAAVRAMMELIREDLRLLGVRHDSFFSERSLTAGPDGDLVAETIRDLRDRDLVHVGTLPPPKGKPQDDWEDREQTLFRATLFGDEVDRPLLKADGSYTYFAADIAYHRSKWLRGGRHLIDVLGADHGGYVRRMAAAVGATTRGEATFEAKLVQMVSLVRDGQPVRMSKRSGSFVTLREVVEEVGADAFRFTMLFRRSDAQMEFDLAQVVLQAKENPVYYVQYGHARCRSALRQAAEANPVADLSPGALAQADLGLLRDPGERELIRLVADWPRQVVLAARTGEPHRIAFFLHETASRLHAHWTRGNADPALRFIVPGNVSVTRARLALAAAVAAVLAAGLGILGVGAPDRMERTGGEGTNTGTPS